MGHISCVERILSAIPSDELAHRAGECASDQRALFHWEQYVRREEENGRLKEGSAEREDVLQHLQSEYARMDEPDGIEGISAHLSILDPAQQALDHRRNGRWAAAQSWYELELAEDPSDRHRQMDLLTCLRDSGQLGEALLYSASQLLIS